jgi:hypothetical protein
MKRKCGACGICYEDFKTGFTYADVYAMLWSGSEDPSTWKYKRRRTVLGLWHSLKSQMWEAHLAACEYVQPALPFTSKETSAVPF